MRSASRADAQAGAVSAEFAIALPAVALVLAACVGGIQAAAVQVQLHAAASSVSRALGRGDAPAADEVIAATVATAAVRARQQGSLVCVDIAQPFAPLPAIVLRASACALANGR